MPRIAFKMKNAIPIVNKKDIENIKICYTKSGKLRDLLLFSMSINTGVKLNDLLALKLEDVVGKDFFVLKDGEIKRIPINNEIKELLTQYGANKSLNSPLFASKSGGTVDRIQIYKNFKSICEELHLPEMIMVASWRKTFGFHYYKKYQDLAFLQWLFNQSSGTETLRYIGIQECINERFYSGLNL